jgi:hypothetical protein
LTACIHLPSIQLHKALQPTFNEHSLNGYSYKILGSPKKRISTYVYGGFKATTAASSANAENLELNKIKYNPLLTPNNNVLLDYADPNSARVDLSPALT